MSTFGPYLITTMEPSGSDLWICGRPALIGSTIYVLLNARTTEGGPPYSNTGLQLWKGESLGAGPWSLADTLTTQTDPAGAWLTLADSYCDGERLWVLWAAEDGLQLSVYDPVAESWTAVATGPTGIYGSGDWLPVRLGRRTDGVFFAGYTYPTTEDLLSVRVHLVTGDTFDEAIEVNPDPAQQWKLADAFAVGNAIQVCVVKGGMGTNHGEPQMAQIDSGGAVGSFETVGTAVDVAFITYKDGTRGGAFGSELIVPLIAESLDEDGSMLPAAAKGSLAGSSWILDQISETPGSGQIAGVSSDQFRIFHDRGRNFIEDSNSEGILLANSYDGSSYAADETILDQSGAGYSNYDQSTAGILADGSIGITVSLIEADSFETPTVITRTIHFARLAVGGVLIQLGVNVSKFIAYAVLGPPPAVVGGGPASRYYSF